MQLKKDIIIAIDGYSSCGKSTLARSLAKILQYRHIDTGAMYRAVALYALQNKWVNQNDIDIQKIIDHINDINIDFSFNKETETNEIFLNGINVEKEIRVPIVSDIASKVSRIQEVRSYLVELQRQIGKQKRIVMDGRDIGTVVFPDADIKFFLTASIEVRAKRRYVELIEKGFNVSLEQVKKEIEERDYLDTTRSISPLRKADDAIVVDNSLMTKEEQLEYLLNIIKSHFHYEN